MDSNLRPGQVRYYKMLRIRMIEERIALKYSEQKMRCPVHLSIGQEGPAVGMCSALKSTDLMVSTHRGHAHYLAMGGTLRGLLCELYGKADGCSRGQGGSMHLVDWNAGFAGSTSIVGGTIPIGVGLAFAKKIKKESGIVVIAIGDAAVEQGVFHESANFASLHELPVIFLCENNLYSCYTHIDDRQPKRDLCDIAGAHGMASITTEGNNCLTAYNVCLNVVRQMRIEPRPVFIEMTTYRQLEHCGPNNDDNLAYRAVHEIANWANQDPLLIAKNQLVNCCEFPKEFEDNSIAEIKAEIDAEFAYAEAAEFPGLIELGKYQYAGN